MAREQVTTAGEPPLDGVPLLVERPRQPPAVPARLGSVQRGDERGAGEIGERDRGVRDEPVVGVHDVRGPVAQHPESAAHHRVAQPEGPGDEVADELEVRRVLGDAQDAHAVDDSERRGVGLGVGAGRMAADEDDVVALVGQRGGERVHVASETTDHDRRVLPGQHQHAHRPRLPSRALSACCSDSRTLGVSDAPPLTPQASDPTRR
jgi:hypothetical protein